MTAGRREFMVGATAVVAAAAAQSALAGPPRAGPDPSLIRPRPASIDAAVAERARRALPTAARNALVYDLTAERTLFRRRADQPIPPASMTKIMTALVAFEAIRAGAVAEDARIRISPRAASRRGSRMGLRAGRRAPLITLIEGLIIASGNDAATAIAEALAGSERAFARRMTERARALGMDSARFVNASGLPARGHRISVRDLARLAAVIEREHPERMALFARRSFTYRGFRQRNRNPALFLNLSDLGAQADGMKTGHTNAAGYCVVATATQAPRGPAAAERRVIVVLAGLRSEAQRARETEQALRWAFAQTPETRPSAGPRRAARTPG